MAYMNTQEQDDKKEGWDIEQLVNGEWVVDVSRVPLSGLLIYRKTLGDNPKYRAMKRIKDKHGNIYLVEDKD
jgi:hypothetical protein